MKDKSDWWKYPDALLYPSMIRPVKLKRGRHDCEQPLICPVARCSGDAEATAIPLNVLRAFYDCEHAYEAA